MLTLKVNKCKFFLIDLTKAINDDKIFLFFTEQS